MTCNASHKVSLKEPGNTNNVSIQRVTNKKPSAPRPSAPKPAKQSMPITAPPPQESCNKAGGPCVVTSNSSGCCPGYICGSSGESCVAAS